MAISIGELQAILTAKTQQFERRMERASKALKPLSNKLNDVSRRLGTLAAATARPPSASEENGSVRSTGRVRRESG